MIYATPIECGVTIYTGILLSPGSGTPTVCQKHIYVDSVSAVKKYQNTNVLELKKQHLNLCWPDRFSIAPHYARVVVIDATPMKSEVCLFENVLSNKYFNKARPSRTK